MYLIYKMKYILCFCLGLAIFLLGNIHCQEDQSITEVRLALDWYPNANHAGIFIAQEKKYFLKEGLKVEIYTPSDPSTVLQTVGAGNDEFGISYQPDLILARDKGIPVISVGAIVQHPLNVVMFLKEKQIKSPKDLKGRKIAYPGIPLNEAILDTMLKFDGLSGIEDVEMINTGWDLVPPVIGKKVDACIGCYISHETIMAANEGYPVEVMHFTDWGVPDYYELILIIGDKYLKENKDVIRRFTKALQQGYEDAMKSPDDAIKILSLNNEIDLNIETPGIKILQDFWDDGDGFGFQSSSKWSKFILWMKEKDLIDNNILVESVFSNQFFVKSIE